MTTMRKARILISALILTAAAASTAALISTEAAPSGSPKIAQLTCKNGWRGSVGGVYGGVSFGLDCNYDRTSTTIEGTDGTVYSARMGAESFVNGAVDCFFSGEAEHVQVSCAEVKLVIK